MFKSKTRPVIIPQSEHARLAGVLAYHWGNADFAAPPLDRLAFTTGITTHDRGYGLLDTMGIGETDQSVWLATQRRGIYITDADPVADTVALLHIRRLLSHNDDAEARALMDVAETRIAANITQTPHTRHDFDRADTITELCDNISFEFCFEQVGQFSATVYTGDDTRDIRVTLHESGHITLNPYPLSVSILRGFIIGYQQTGYPDHPEPILIDYTITTE